MAEENKEIARITDEQKTALEKAAKRLEYNKKQAADNYDAMEDAEKKLEIEKLKRPVRPMATSMVTPFNQPSFRTRAAKKPKKKVVPRQKKVSLFKCGGTWGLIIR
jgi:hypothetical protein